jgi:hypothetical protein
MSGCVNPYIDCSPTGSVIYFKFDHGGIVGAKCHYDIEGEL